MSGHHRWATLKHKRKPAPVVVKRVDETLQERVQQLHETYRNARLHESEEEAVGKLILMLATEQWKHPSQPPPNVQGRLRIPGYRLVSTDSGASRYEGMALKPTKPEQPKTTLR